MKNLNFLIILGILSIVVACSKRNSQPDTEIKSNKSREIDLSKYAVMGLDSPFISKDSANIMIGSYLNSIASTGSGKIKSFIVDADALRYYLQDEDIKFIKVMLAHKLSYVRGGGQNQDVGYMGSNLTVVIAGFDEDNNYIYSPQGAVLDFTRPCPADCPTNGSASYDLFPQ